MKRTVAILMMIFVLLLCSCMARRVEVGGGFGTSDHSHSYPCSCRPDAELTGSLLPTHPSTHETESDTVVEDPSVEAFVLPLTGARLRIDAEEKRLMSNYRVGEEMLVYAEAELVSRMPQDYEEPYFRIYESDGVLYLGVELIVPIDPPRVPVNTDPDSEGVGTGEYSGCGIDHEHMFFKAELSRRDMTTTEPYESEFLTTD